MIQLTDVTKSDWNFILELRNSFFDNFYNQDKPIEKKEHYEYLENQNKNSTFFHWIIESNNEKIGYVRILDNDIGIMIKKDFHNKGIATIALQLAEEKAKSLGIDKLIALVKIDNESSKKIFENNDFKLHMYWYEKEIK